MYLEKINLKGEECVKINNSILITNRTFNFISKYPNLINEPMLKKELEQIRVYLTPKQFLSAINHICYA